MTRISKTFAKTVASELLKEALKEEALSIREEAKSFADDIYEDVYKRELNMMEEMPDGFLYQKAGLTVSMAGEFYQFEFSGRTGLSGSASLSKVIGIPGAIHRPISWADRYHSAKSYPPSSKTYKRFQRLERSMSDFADKYARLHTETVATISAANTYKRLAEQWPELAPWIKKHAPASHSAQSKALAVDVAALNASLKLTGDSN